MTALDLGGMLLLGLAGTAHCAGMCGGFVLCLSGAGRPGPRQAAWQAGRGLAYATFGGALGVLGLGARTAWDAGGGRVAILLAAALMVVVGLGFLGVLPRFEPLARSAGPLRSRLTALLRKGTVGSAFGLGLMTGLLPCGLLYAALGRAAASSGPLEGAALMLAFWVGSSPGLLGLAGLAPVLSRWNPVWWPRVAGLVTIGLGLAMAAHALQAPAAGPACGHCG